MAYPAYDSRVHLLLDKEHDFCTPRTGFTPFTKKELTDIYRATTTHDGLTLQIINDYEKISGMPGAEVENKILIYTVGTNNIVHTPMTDDPSQNEFVEMLNIYTNGIKLTKIDAVTSPTNNSTEFCKKIIDLISSLSDNTLNVDANNIPFECICRNSTLTIHKNIANKYDQSSTQITEGLCVIENKDDVGLYKRDGDLLLLDTFETDSQNNTIEWSVGTTSGVIKIAMLTHDTYLKHSLNRLGDAIRKIGTNNGLITFMTSAYGLPELSLDFTVNMYKIVCLEFKTAADLLMAKDAKYFITGDRSTGLYAIRNFNVPVTLTSHSVAAGYIVYSLNIDTNFGKIKKNVRILIQKCINTYTYMQTYYETLLTSSNIRSNINKKLQKVTDTLGQVPIIKLKFSMFREEKRKPTNYFPVLQLVFDIVEKMVARLHVIITKYRELFGNNIIKDLLKNAKIEAEHIMSLPAATLAPHAFSTFTTKNNELATTMKYIHPQNLKNWLCVHREKISEYEEEFSVDMAVTSNISTNLQEIIGHCNGFKTMSNQLATVRLLNDLCKSIYMLYRMCNQSDILDSDELEVIKCLRNTSTTDNKSFASITGMIYNDMIANDLYQYNLVFDKPYSALGKFGPIYTYCQKNTCEPELAGSKGGAISALRRVQSRAPSRVRRSLFPRPMPRDRANLTKESVEQTSDDIAARIYLDYLLGVISESNASDADKDLHIFIVKYLYVVGHLIHLVNYIIQYQETQSLTPTIRTKYKSAQHYTSPKREKSKMHSV